MRFKTKRRLVKKMKKRHNFNQPVFDTVLYQIRCLCVCVFYLLSATLMQSHIEMNQTCVRVATRRCDHFTPSHRIWTLVSFQGFLSTRRTNLCCRRVYRKSDQLISGRWVGFLREWILRRLKGLNRWMDRLLEEWWDQRIIALFVFKPVNYIIFD